MAVIQDLVLTFCPTMHSVQQKKLKLLMPVLFCTSTCPPHDVNATQELSQQAKLPLFTASCR